MHQPNYSLSLYLSHTHPYIGSYTGHTNHLYAIFTIRMRFLLHIIKEIRKKWSRFIALKIEVEDNKDISEIQIIRNDQLYAKNGCTSNWIHANAIPAFRSFVVAHLWICLVKVAIVATCFDGCIKAQFKAIFIPHVLLWKIGARLVILTMTSWGFSFHHTHKKETKCTNFMLYLCKYKMILSSTLNYMHFHSHYDGGGKNIKFYGT